MKKIQYGQLAHRLLNDNENVVLPFLPLNRGRMCCLSHWQNFPSQGQIQAFTLPQVQVAATQHPIPTLKVNRGCRELNLTNF